MQMRFCWRPVWRAAAVTGAICLTAGAPALAQRGTIGAHVAAAGGGPFEETDAGMGGRVTWRLWPMIDLDGEVTVYPGHYPDRAPFSGVRVEVYGGVSGGPGIGRVRPFVRLRPGFLVSGAAPRPLACITIFPPPLACVLAQGDTMPVLDLGGGVEFGLTARTFFRLDAGHRLVWYPGPSLEQRGRGAGRDLAGDFRLAAGAGVRF